MISIATKSTLTIKNVVHLTTGIKCNVSFTRNNSFYEKNFFMKTLTTFLVKLKNAYFFNFSHCFSANCKFENANVFHFWALYSLKVSVALTKFSESYLGEIFLGFFENVTLFLKLIPDDQWNLCCIIKSYDNSKNEFSCSKTFKIDVNPFEERIGSFNQ